MTIPPLQNNRKILYYPGAVIQLSYQTTSLRHHISDVTILISSFTQFRWMKGMSGANNSFTESQLVTLFIKPSEIPCSSFRCYIYSSTVQKLRKWFKFPNLSVAPWAEVARARWISSSKRLFSSSKRAMSSGDRLCWLMSCSSWRRASFSLMSWRRSLSASAIPGHDSLSSKASCCCIFETL